MVLQTLLTALTLLFVSLVIFVSARHIAILRSRLARPLKLPSDLAFSPNSDSSANHAPYFFIVLGSGGHTKEMLAMMEPGIGAFGAMHRRYVVSSGDSMSLEQLRAFEDEMRLHGPTEDETIATAARAENAIGEQVTVGGKHAEVGSWDVHIVRRARRVHQPLWSTPASAVVSFFQLFYLLLKSPTVGTRAANVPDVVVTNGPATGFFAGLAAHVLKIFYLVPEGKLRLLYVESWARIWTLSLTGKLFYHIGIADVFVVQHEPVAKKYGVVNAGWLVVGSWKRKILKTA